MNIKYDLHTLEFPTFIDKLRRSAISSFASDRILHVSPLTSLKEVLEMQEDLKAVLSYFNKNTSSDIFNDSAFYSLFQRINSEDERNLSLEPADYLTIMDFIQNLYNLKQNLTSKKHLLERLIKYINLINPDIAFAGQIEQTFDSDGNIKDSASPELRIMRRRIRDVRQKVTALLKDVFTSASADKFIQEKVVVLRSGRYTIPVKTNYSQYIRAIVHDRSSSGQTVYVEPSVCVAVNNELQETIINEQQEIARILSSLLKQFLSGLQELYRTVDNYKELVFRIELGAFFHRYEITFPEFGDIVKLVDIHHPLLFINKGGDSVPVSMSYNANERLIVVSGPNTGGKTVSIKSMGLNHIVALCGLPVFAKRADMIFFDNIRADIGDKQSLVMDLSTFSSHMTNISSIITGVSGRSLVLFDELGTGTDPKEGAALAISILNYLIDKNTHVMLTTHFSEIKAYAFDREDAKIYSVGFDYDTFTPQYHLVEGVAGSSDPILIARRIGFPDEVIEEAGRLMNGYKSTTDVALEELNLMRAEAEHIKRGLMEREKALSAKEEQLGTRQEELQDKLSKRELDLLEESYALLQRSKRLAEERIKATPEKIAQDIRDAGERIQELKSKRKVIEDIGPGDTIFLEKYAKLAKIISIEGNHVYIDLEGIRVRIDRKELVGKKAGEPKPKTIKVSASKKTDVRSEIVLVGKRVEEAIDILDKYIDESQRAGYDKVYVVHGRGSGQLRRGVQEFLRVCGRIKGYATASQEEGGDAVTVVNL